MQAWTADYVKFNLSIEKHLALMKSKFLAGDNLTASDFHLYALVYSFALNKNCNHPNVQKALEATHGTS